ncbi:hypothetical protein NDU88_003927 [Pleurodeles waltl]|uniref:Uncharacterized protein n=1 Tax=Pleurodeles waltl TaxID=8319 RepID=A0AAV7LMY4_PLEWA|nr:hypothetical protein NDU88_003927 [Pleurodeles waltl]
MEPSKVVKALKVLQDEGREDLIKEGVLEEAWVGLRRPKRLSAEGVSAAVAACASPLKTFKKFKSESANGRKVTRSPEIYEVVRGDIVALQSLGGVPRRSASSLPRRQGSSLLQRVTAGGRGSGLVSAVRVGGRMGVQVRFAHARMGKTRQARSPLERGDKLNMGAVEERPLGGTSKVAAPSVDSRLISALKERELGTPVKMAALVSNIEDEVVVISDDDEDVQVTQDSVLVKGTKGDVGFSRQRGGKIMQWIPRVVSPMLHRVQSWEVGNQAVFRLGEQIELVDKSGAVLKGTDCGEVSSTGAMGRAI